MNRANGSRYICEIWEHIGDKKNDSSVTIGCEIIVLRWEYQK